MANDLEISASYVALLERLRAGGPDPVWAPEFRREIEEPIGSAVEVAPDCALVITEGNYLLAAEPPSKVRNSMSPGTALAVKPCAARALN